jgi:hypothetical protein
MSGTTTEDIAALISAATDHELVESFVTMKTEVEDIETKHKEKVATRKERMLQIQAELLARLNDRGSDGITIKGLASVYRKLTTKPQVNDWGVMHAWAQARVDAGTPVAEIMEMMQRRVNLSTIQDIIATTGAPVPGISLQQIYEVAIRRS